MKVLPNYEMETPGLLADPIRLYLEQHEKAVHDEVLTDTVRRMREVIVKDLMQPRDTRAGKESNTLYTGACARKARLTYDGAAREPLRARTVLKFLLGDLVELSVLAMARLAGCHIEDNNIDLTIKGEDGVLVPVHPDGRYVGMEGYSYNVEIKSCDSRTFDAWLAQGGPDDTWGYLTQASVEIQAWREAGLPIESTIFVAVSTGSRQGSIAEFIMPYKEELVIGWHERRLAVQQIDVPAIPFQAQPEMAFMRGKACQADWFAHGEPTPRLNEKSAIYGWDVMTGRQVVPLQCTYCEFRAAHCWKEAVLEIDGTKPIWVVPVKQEQQDQDTLREELEPLPPARSVPSPLGLPVPSRPFGTASGSAPILAPKTGTRTISNTKIITKEETSKITSQDKGQVLEPPLKETLREMGLGQADLLDETRKLTTQDYISRAKGSESVRECSEVANMAEADPDLPVPDLKAIRAVVSARMKELGKK